ncbi:MAG: hypothetical protein DSO03_07055 [Hadesarchaea archaeon]|nr:MAG: hypothetical protein DSO03_07055 [Hadesarchaea archaeon]
MFFTGLGKREWMGPLRRGLGVHGISPLIATIFLLGLILMVFVVYVVGLAGRGGTTPLPPIYTMLEVENQDGKLVIRHGTGDTVTKAFKLYNGAVTWLNLLVRLNGENLNVTGGARVGNLTTGMVDFGPGSRLELPVSVRKGDTVTVIYVPTGQILGEHVF